ncbi:response regulator transcription factor [Pelagibacterium sp. H642]|uniref:response regulator transcription factor n=1 Tax=Pelagibacterium sp. H642 TaxID=1881069 RepID=UPI00281525D4|nr:response regulator transcription factor [Pelagibacterium sp. H642]WMT91802.1 response regulator transcription factor [Pelagibacterium sp. H642]
MRALVVEDDARIAATLDAALSSAGLAVTCRADGEEAWFLAGTEPFDIIVLDLGLPGLDGMTLLKRWRSEGVMTPVIILTARSHWAERVDGIEAGADDYLVKPFRPEELLARLRAIIRRSSGHATSRIEIEDLVIDTRMKEVTRGGVPIPMPPQEYRLLTYLAHKAGSVVSQLELTEHLYAQDFMRDSNSIEKLVGRVRKRLGNDVIKTRRGFGYFVESPDA